MDEISTIACRHLDEWGKFRKEGKGAQAALIASFSVAVAAYCAAATFVDIPILGHLSTVAGLAYLGVLTLGNVQLTRLLVEVMLPTRTLKILAAVQVALTSALFACSPWPAMRYVSVVLTLGILGVLASSFALRMTMQTTQQRKDNYALVSTIASVTRKTVRDIRASPELQKNPRMVSHMVQNAAAAMGCHTKKKMCPLRRTQPI